MRFWGVQCMEHWYPGMWQRWFKAQCAAVGWPNQKLHGKTTDRGWSKCRGYLLSIEPGDWVMVQLRNFKVGRLGEVVRVEPEDHQWNPLAKPKKSGKGEMGRRIHVRWDLENAPPDVNTVVKLPSVIRPPVRSTINPLAPGLLETVREAMADKKNWVGLNKLFPLERHLSDYLAAHPHRLEHGMLPFPDAKLREKVFSDRSRMDVLLEDSDGTPVVVECKQHPPGKDAIKQIKQYMRHIRTEMGSQPRGIVCYGGSPRVSPEVRTLANELGIDLVHYELAVQFSK